jgi:hypothetical protein
MSGVLRLSNNVTGRSTINASASNDQTYTLPALGGTLVTGGASSELIFPPGTEALPGLHVQGDVDTGLYAPAANTLGISTAGSERLRIDSSGNVGIGLTTNIGATLHVDPATDVTTGFGAPLIKVGGANSWGGPGSLYSIGLGYNNGSTVKSPAEIGLVTTSATGVTKGALVFATRDVTTDTAPTERMRIDSSGKVGIGTTSPQHALVVGSGTDDALNVDTQSAGGGVVLRSYDDGTTDYEPFGIAAEYVNFYIRTGVNSSAEKARIDSSGRLLVGTSSSSGADATVQSIGTFPAQFHRGADVTGGPNVVLSKSRNTAYGSNTIVQDGDTLGTIQFRGDDGTDYQSTGAYIQAFVDGTPGADDMPGRLVFSTTADGASSPTERMRISSSGGITWANSDAILESFNSFADARIRGTAAGCNIYVQSNGQTGVIQTGTGWISASSIRIKNVVDNVDPNQCWEFVKNISLKRYYYKDQPQEGVTYLGPIAEEISALDSEMSIMTNQEDSEGKIPSYNEPLMHMKALAALQTALVRIETLEASNIDLLARVTALETQ